MSQATSRIIVQRVALKQATPESASALSLLLSVKQYSSRTGYGMWLPPDQGSITLSKQQFDSFPDIS